MYEQPHYLEDVSPTNAETEPRPAGVLFLVEGLNDIDFLRRISRILHRDQATIPDLTDLERAERLVFVPIGGGGLQHWSHRLHAIGWREFHLYDRETLPETHCRERVARAINARPGCHAMIMSKRSLENYLHPLAIEEAKGIKVAFSELDPVPDLVARLKLPAGFPWEQLSRRTQNRLRYRAKKWLNRDAVDHMSARLLAEQDRAGELVSWLEMIGHLAG